MNNLKIEDVITLLKAGYTRAEIDGYVNSMKQGTQSWCSGTTQRDGMGREVGGGFGMGDTHTPVADSCQCMAKTTTIL